MLNTCIVNGVRVILNGNQFEWHFDLRWDHKVMRLPDNPPKGSCLKKDCSDDDVDYTKLIVQLPIK